MRLLVILLFFSVCFARNAARYPSSEPVENILFEALAGDSAQAIQNREARAAARLAAGDAVFLPELKEHTARVLQARGVEVLGKRDLFTEVRLPTGWTHAVVKEDPRFRDFEDADGVHVMTTFFKDTGYDRYGYTMLGDWAEENN